MPIRQKNGILLTYKIYVRRKMDTQRLTLRLSQQQITTIDIFVKAGEFATRSEVIRHAVNEFINKYAENIIDKAEKIKKVQEFALEFESIKPYMKK
jgi:Arc/MetJ-type ribon-helix-helix transcriptional regulator